MDVTLGYETTPRTSRQLIGVMDTAPKSVRSEYGEIDLKVPRDREGEHIPLIVRNIKGALPG